MGRGAVCVVQYAAGVPAVDTRMMCEDADADARMARVGVRDRIAHGAVVRSRQRPSQPVVEHICCICQNERTLA